MDNVTHTLVGLALGEAATRLRSRRDASGAERLRSSVRIAAVVASNAPDLDFLLARLTPGGTGYLLHHRGHTHTVLGALGLALLVLGVFAFAARARRAPLARADWRQLALVALASLGLHIAMDFTNAYGVHPFWPWANRWLYGDAVFILEPLLWIALLPPLFRDARTRRGKALFSTFFAAALGLCLFTGYVPWQLALPVALGGLWFAGSMRWGPLRRAGPGSRLAIAFFAATSIVAVFFAVSREVRLEASRLIAAQFPGTRIHDLALSPFPANPLCWHVHTVETTRGEYVARRGVFAAAPRLLGAGECPDLRFSGGLFLTEPVPAPPRPELLWSGQFRAPLDELRRLNASSCEIAAALRFMRVPAWTHQDGALIFGDLRFDRRRELDFAKLAVAEPGSRADCPPNVPPWTPPRADLLE